MLFFEIYDINSSCVSFTVFRFWLVLSRKGIFRNKLRYLTSCKNRIMVAHQDYGCPHQLAEVML